MDSYTDLEYEIPVSLDYIKENIKDDFECMLECEVDNIELDYQQEIDKIEAANMALEKKTDVIKWKIQCEINAFISFLIDISKSASGME